MLDKIKFSMSYLNPALIIVSTYLAVIMINILILCNSNSSGRTNSNQVQMLTRCKINYSISVFDDGGPYSFITSALKINETED